MIDDSEARRSIVEAADRLFYARGVNSIGMDAVRAESGFALKRIYKLFPSKEDLVVAVLEHRSQRWDAGVAATVATASDPADRLLAVFDFLGAWFREDDFRGCAFINAYGELAAGSSRVAQAVRRQKESFNRYVEDLVGQVGGTPELAAQLALLAEGAQTSAAISGSPSAAEAAREAARILIDASVARAEAA